MELTASSLAASAFRVIPLRPRAVGRRRDVGPFVLVYAMLLALDQYIIMAHHHNHWVAQYLATLPIISPSTLLTLWWSLALLSHLALVWSAQWSVRVKAWVGYYPYTLNVEQTMRLISQRHQLPTHALVQSLQEEHFAGEIVELVVQQLEPTTTTTSSSSSSSSSESRQMNLTEIDEDDDEKIEKDTATTTTRCCCGRF